MYRRNFRILSSIITLLILAIFVRVFTHAQTSNASIPFNIEAIKPANQYNKKKDYIDAIYQTGKEQKVQVKVYNNSTNNQHLIANLNDATTSNGLAIDYINKKQKLIGNPKISNLINGQSIQKFLMKPKSSKIITFTLNMPSDHFKGIIMGGISLYKDDDYYKQDNDKRESNITNKFVYSTTVILRNQSGDVLPDLKLKDVQQAPTNSYPTVVSTLQNDKRNFLSGVNTKMVIKNDSGKILTKYYTKMGQVAPMSEFHLATPLAQSLTPGTYELSGEADASDGQHWNWNKKFTVTQNNYENTEKNIIQKQKQFPWWIIILIILLVVIILLLWIIFILFKRRKKDDDENN